MTDAQTKWCSKGKHLRPISEFLYFAARDVKVTYCNACAQKQMSAYWAARVGGEALKTAAMNAR